MCSLSRRRDEETPVKNGRTDRRTKPLGTDTTVILKRHDRRIADRGAGANRAAANQSGGRQMRQTTACLDPAIRPRRRLGIVHAHRGEATAPGITGRSAARLAIYMWRTVDGKGFLDV